MATILDVERESGVSKSTISRYLNGGRVKESNRIKIEKAIKKLNYRVNPIAKGLKTNRTYTVGVLIPDITDIFYTQIIKSCESFLNSQGYSIILCDYSDDIKKERQRFEFLLDKKIDGLIFASSGMTDQYIKAVMDKDVPVVLIDRLIPGVQCDSVMVDNLNGTYNALVKAIKKGHRKIGVVNGPQEIYTAKERYKGYLRALEDYGVPINDDYILFGDFKQESGKKLFMQIYNMKDRPTLIFIANLFMALGAAEAIVEHGIKVPEEVSVLSFDDITDNPFSRVLSHVIQPKISNIKQPIEDIG
ncbi:MAG: LacI family DNA-binding transcriptional regulator, partial [Clostridia bacterium]|nr:LacI family DNA-binding transcriptional regulator [Clostridia bacterium]